MVSRVNQSNATHLKILDGSKMDTNFFLHYFGTPVIDWTQEKIVFDPPYTRKFDVRLCSGKLCRTMLRCVRGLCVRAFFCVFLQLLVEKVGFFSFSFFFFFVFLIDRRRFAQKRDAAIGCLLDDVKVLPSLLLYPFKVPQPPVLQPCSPYMRFVSLGEIIFFLLFIFLVLSAASYLRPSLTLIAVQRYGLCLCVWLVCVCASVYLCSLLIFYNNNIS